jgi:hypothetical protein
VSSFSALLVIAAAIASAADSAATLRVRFIPTSCDVRTHSLIEGFVVVENCGAQSIRLPASLQLGNGYAQCLVRHENGDEDSCMGETLTTWPTSPDSVVNVPPGGAYAVRTAFLARSHEETLELGLMLHLPPDKIGNTPRQTIRSEWTKVTLRARE